MLKKSCARVRFPSPQAQAKRGAEPPCHVPPEDRDRAKPVMPKKNRRGVGQRVGRFHPSRVGRFWARVRKSSEEACWEWSGSTFENGYGHVYILGKTALVHRYSYELHFEMTLNTNDLICHTCDNRICVNPSHLFIGTHQDNSTDMVEKGRQARGSRLKHTKLSADDREAIRDIYRQGLMSQRALGTLYGIAQQTISQIINHTKGY
jgi:hypothetical protein